MRVFIAFALLLAALFAEAQSKNNTSTVRVKRSSDSLPSAHDNTLRVFPLNLAESALHLSFERKWQGKWAVGAEGLQTMGEGSSLLYPDAQIQETYFGPLAQYYIFEDFKGFFVEGGLNFARARVSANVGLRDEKLSKEQSYIMPHVTANYRFRLRNGFTATGGLGLMSFLGGDELKIEEERKGFVDGAYVEKKTTVQTPYGPSPKLRVRLDIGYSF